MFQVLAQLSSDVISTYSYRVGGPTSFPFNAILLIAISITVKLGVGLVLLYGVVKVFKTKKIQDIISKI